MGAEHDEGRTGWDYEAAEGQELAGAGLVPRRESLGFVPEAVPLSGILGGDFSIMQNHSVLCIPFRTSLSKIQAAFLDRFAVHYHKFIVHYGDRKSVV